MNESYSYSRSTKRSMAINKTVTVLSYIVMIFVLVCLFVPIFLVLVCMFKDKREIFPANWYLFPKNWTDVNFTRLATLQKTSIGVNFYQSLLTTFGVAALSTVLSLSVNSLAGYGFARLNFPCKKLIFGLTIVTMFIPGITILLTSISVVSALGMMNTLWVLVIPGVASAYNIFFFKQFYSGFPKDYDEAARVDGCNSWSIFFRIYLPNSSTPMVIMGAGTFMGYFNSYLWPTLTIDHDHRNLYQIMTIIRKLFDDASTLGYGAVLAASFIAMLPALVVFVIVQRYIKEGIALSGVK